VEFVLFEGAFVALAVLEVLGSFAVEHSVVPVSFVLLYSSFSVEDSPSTLHTISEVTFVPAAITPPKSSFSVSLSRFEFSLINIALFPSPSINTSSFFLIESEFTKIVVSCCEVQLTLSFKLAVMELSIDNLMGILEEAKTFSMGTIYFSLSDVDYLWVFEELGGVEAWL
jgi:hypothetical protein